MWPDIAPEGPSEKPKWMVMVYMGVGTIEGTADLTEAAEADLSEMELIGSGGDLNVLVQVNDGSAVPRRGHIGKKWEDAPPKERDFAGGQALADFIRWSIGKAQHDPSNKAHYSMLVLWGHAYDFTFGHVRTKTGVIDALDFAELSRILQGFRAEYGEQAKLDILGFDACDLATVEMACQLEQYADYLLGSEIGIPVPGWPYDRILDRLRHPIGRLMGPPELGAYVVKRFCESYRAVSPVSLSLLDLKRAGELFDHAEGLAATLFGAIEDPDVLDQLIGLFARSQTGEGRPYVDVADLCLSLTREIDDDGIAAAARGLGDFLLSSGDLLVGKSAEGSGQPFVVAHGRNACATARLNGISIYAPHVVPFRDFETVLPLYHNFNFANRTQWSRLVHTLAELS
jgi:hypothetical protein